MATAEAGRQKVFKNVHAGKTRSSLSMIILKHKKKTDLARLKARRPSKELESLGSKRADAREAKTRAKRAPSEDKNMQQVTFLDPGHVRGNLCPRPPTKSLGNRMAKVAPSEKRQLQSAIKPCSHSEPAGLLGSAHP